MNTETTAPLNNKLKPTSNTADTELEKLKKLHIRLLEVMEKLHTLLGEQGIPYYMIEGSMLGAARHQGFIPWDDDMDIAVTRTDFNKLIEIPTSVWDSYDLEFGFYTVNPQYKHKYIKIYDKNSTMVYGEGNVIKGVFIDIMPLDGAFNSRLLSKLHLKIIHHYKKCLWYSYAYPHQNPHYFFRKIAIKKGPVYWYRKLHNYTASKSYEKSKLGGLMMGVYGEREIMDRRYYGTPTLYQFEDRQFYGVAHPDEYLSSVYGDWKKLPPIAEQEPHHMIQYIDLNLPFAEYQ